MGWYVKRPIRVEAYQRPRGVALVPGNHGVLAQMGIGLDLVYAMLTLGVAEGDWVAKDVAGQWYPIKNAVFEQTYDKAEDA
jgi:hypothetical protein